MDFKIFQRKKLFWAENKKMLYAIGVIVVLILILLGFWFFVWQPQRAAQRAAELEKQKIAQQLLEKKKNNTYSRPSFFLSAPVGARGAFNVPFYGASFQLQGNWRMADTFNANKKMTILYVKNPNYTAPLLYVRYDAKADFKLAPGETALKTDSTKYSYAYYFYPVDSYPGPDKADFTAMQKDFQDVLPTFGIF